MRKISEVLRLQAEGLSMRQIGQSVGLARSTVSDYVERARRAGIRWPLTAELNDAELEGKLFPAPPAVAPGQRPEPDLREVHREMKRGRHVTLQLLWLEWRSSNPEGWAYSQFCLYYRRWLGLQDVVMRLEYRAGDRLFVDYSGDRMPVGTPGSDEVWQAEIFVAVLGASGYLYVEATRGQELQSWLGAHGCRWAAGESPRSMFRSERSAARVGGDGRRADCFHRSGPTHTLKEHMSQPSGGDEVVEAWIAATT